MASKNNWNADQMQGTLISDMEKEVKEGLRRASGNNTLDGSNKAAENPLNNREGKPTNSGVGKPTNSGVDNPLNNRIGNPTGDSPIKGAADTKGVQTYITLDDYQRLTYFKLKRGKGTTIANLVAEAIAQWLDVQEGKRQVT